mmetsp:Transcript_21266/g.47959  ORF Transcript_21266/g.47959 Transcript_21266/m.47959 type:complete len:257 (-) Transcript_21266:124-894(-)
MLLLLGLDSGFAWAETLQTYAIDWIQANNPQRRITGKLTKQVLTGISVALFLPGIIFSTRVGPKLLDVVDHFCPTYTLLFVSLTEYILIAYKYGAEQMIEDLEKAASPGLKRFIYPRALAIQMKYVGPVGVGFILFMSLIDEFSGSTLKVNSGGYWTYQGYPTGIIIFLGWGSVVLPLGYFLWTVWKFQIRWALGQLWARATFGNRRRYVAGPGHGEAVGGGYPHGLAAPAVVGRVSEKLPEHPRHRTGGAEGSAT